MTDRPASADQTGSIKLGAILTGIMTVGFFVFVSIGTFNSAALSTSVRTGGTTSVGILFGIGLIAASVFTTLVYAAHTNAESRHKII